MRYYVFLWLISLSLSLSLSLFLSPLWHILPLNFHFFIFSLCLHSYLYNKYIFPLRSIFSCKLDWVRVDLAVLASHSSYYSSKYYSPLCECVLEICFEIFRCLSKYSPLVVTCRVGCLGNMLIKLIKKMPIVTKWGVDVCQKVWKQSLLVKNS